MTRMLVSNGNPLEKIVGFSRAVRVGSYISVWGMPTVDHEGITVGVGDPVVQAHRCFEIIKEAIECAGGTINDVVRTRVFLTRIEDWEKVIKVRAKYFATIRPVDTHHASIEVCEP